MKAVFDAENMTLLAEETGTNTGESQSSTEQTAAPEQTAQKGKSGPDIKVFIIIGTLAVLAAAVILAVRSANKKYGKEW